jgi:chromosome segregation ATPase
MNTSTQPQPDQPTAEAVQAAHVTAALAWAEAEAKQRRECGHEFIAGKLTTILGELRRLTAERDALKAEVTQWKRELANTKNITLYQLRAENEKLKASGGTMESQWHKAEEEITALRARLEQAEEENKGLRLHVAATGRLSCWATYENVKAAQLREKARADAAGPHGSV